MVQQKVKDLKSLNVYDRVYKKLIELETEEISVSDFYTLIGNMKIPKEDIVGFIEEKLFEMGLTTTQVDRICSNLSFKLRWTKRDAREIENHLRESGLLSKKGFSVLKINKKDCKA